MNPMLEFQICLRVKCEYVSVCLWENELAIRVSMPERKMSTSTERGASSYVEHASPAKSLIVALVVVMEAQADVALLVDVHPPGEQLGIDAVGEASQHEREGRELIAIQVLDNLTVQQAATIQPWDRPLYPCGSFGAPAPCPLATSQLLSKGVEEPEVVNGLPKDAPQVTRAALEHAIEAAGQAVLQDQCLCRCHLRPREQPLLRHLAPEVHHASTFLHATFPGANALQVARQKGLQIRGRGSLLT